MNICPHGLLRVGGAVGVVRTGPGREERCNASSWRGQDPALRRGIGQFGCCCRAAGPSVHASSLHASSLQTPTRPTAEVVLVWMSTPTRGGTTSPSEFASTSAALHLMRRDLGRVEAASPGSRRRLH